MIDRQAPGTSDQLTLGADKAYDAREFVADLRQKCVTPHVAQKVRSSAIDGRTTRHAGYGVSQGSASSSRRPSAGPRPSLAAPRSRCAGWRGSDSTSRWQWQPTTSSRLPKLIGEAA